MKCRPKIELKRQVFWIFKIPLAFSAQGLIFDPANFSASDNKIELFIESILKTSIQSNQFKVQLW